MGKVDKPTTFGWAFCERCGKLQRIVALKGSDGTSGVTPAHDDPKGSRCPTSALYWQGCTKPWYPTKDAALAAREKTVAS